VCVCDVFICIFIYIYIYTHREGERETGGSRKEERASEDLRVYGLG
jgi:hypothetical protein